MDERTWVVEATASHVEAHVIGCWRDLPDSAATKPLGKAAEAGRSLSLWQRGRFYVAVPPELEKKAGAMTGLN